MRVDLHLCPVNAMERGVVNEECGLKDVMMLISHISLMH